MVGRPRRPRCHSKTGNDERGYDVKAVGAVAANERAGSDGACRVKEDAGMEATSRTPRPVTGGRCFAAIAERCPPKTLASNQQEVRTNLPCAISGSTRDFRACYQPYLRVPSSSLSCRPRFGNLDGQA
jgi:hypothetical protein